jgi:hypothetical protein
MNFGSIEELSGSGFSPFAFPRPTTMELGLRLSD